MVTARRRFGKAVIVSVAGTPLRSLDTPSQ
jgi:hypothetical protein